MAFIQSFKYLLHTYYSWGPMLYIWKTRTEVLQIIQFRLYQKVGIAATRVSMSCWGSTGGGGPFYSSAHRHLTTQTTRIVQAFSSSIYSPPSCPKQKATHPITNHVLSILLLTYYLMPVTPLQISLNMVLIILSLE